MLDDESTCVGVSKYPLQDFDYSMTTDMWLYRANDGYVYHAGKEKIHLQPYSQGDMITVEVNMVSKSISFAKNDSKLQLAGYFDVDILYPVVVFQGGQNEKRVSVGACFTCQNAPPVLSVGDPLCAPSAAVLAQSTVDLLRSLHGTHGWMAFVNDVILNALKSAGELLGNETRRWMESVMMDAGINSEETRQGQGDSSRMQHLIKDDVVDHLCVHVWPVLAVIGGVDDGLRVGARCVLVNEDKMGTILGSVKRKSRHVHVQLDDADSPTV